MNVQYSVKDEVCVHMSMSTCGDCAHTALLCGVCGGLAVGCQVFVFQPSLRMLAATRFPRSCASLSGTPHSW